MKINHQFLREEKNGFKVYRTFVTIDDKEVGELIFLWIPEEFNNIKESLKKWIDHPEVGMVKVHPDYRRKGIATKMYKYTSEFLNKEFGLNLYDSDLITPDGKNFKKSLKND
jgi:GNAT superfamily N-acetyltransferase